MQSLLILTTTSCPKCPEISKYIHEKVEGYNLAFRNENNEDFAYFCKKFDATQAPTVILLDEEDEERGRAHDLGELKELLK